MIETCRKSLEDGTRVVHRMSSLPWTAAACRQRSRYSAISVIPAGKAESEIATCAGSAAGTIWAADGTRRLLTGSAARAAATLSPRLTCCAAGGSALSLRSSYPPRLRYGSTLLVDRVGSHGSSAIENGHPVSIR